MKKRGNVTIPQTGPLKGPFFMRLCSVPGLIVSYLLHETTNHSNRLLLHHMSKILFIAFSGALGSVLRYACAGWVQRSTSGLFPVGTLAVNVVGCACIGFFGLALSEHVLVREEHRLALLVGLFGGFTTFSTFGWETFALINDGQWYRAGANVLVSNVLGLFAVWFGYRLAEKYYGG